MHALLRRRSLVALLALLFAASACSSGGSSDGGSPDAGTSGSSSSATEPAAAGGPAALEDLAFGEDDLVDGEQFVVPADGTAVSDASPTLEFCQIDLPSEADREARHRVQVMDSQFAEIATTEAVRYPSGTSAAAINELRDAFTDCPEEEPVDVGEGELVTYSAFPIDEAELGGLASDHVGADVTATTEDGASSESAIVVQRRGDVLIAVQGPDRDRVIALATAAGARLEAADGASVGD